MIRGEKSDTAPSGSPRIPASGKKFGPVLPAMFCAAAAMADGLFEGGHAKGRLEGIGYSGDSLFALTGDAPAFDQGGDLRLEFSTSGAGWAFRADYQLIGQFGDSLEPARSPSDPTRPPDAVQDDDRRLLDLTHAIGGNDERAVVQRLDRLHAEYRAERWIARVGRQAVSWGNGLIYTPMDVFHPFDPAAVDTEYKSGDDMAYGQYLRDNGDDWQAVWIVRRDENGNLDRDFNSLALKYHGFAGAAEYDLLVAEHYGDTMVGAGGALPWGGAVLRADLTVTDTGEDTALSAVAGWSWSWLGWGKNMSGALEYYYNGFGQEDEAYRPGELSDNPELLVRLERGELFTLARHYLAGSALAELTPLFRLTFNLFYNLEDGSFLPQLVGHYDVAQNWRLLVSLNVPAGSSGSEYGGYESAAAGYEVGYDAALFAQLAWYF